MKPQILRMNILLSTLEIFQIPPKSAVSASPLQTSRGYASARSAPRCALRTQEPHRRARFHKHTETCVRRLYELLRQTGADNIMGADVERGVHKSKLNPEVRPDVTVVFLFFFTISTCTSTSAIPTYTCGIRAWDAALP